MVDSPARVRALTGIAWEGTSPRSFMALLCKLRWLAVAGQAATIAIVTGPMHVALPIVPLWSGVLALAAFNAYASMRAARARDTGTTELFAHMLVDIVVLTWLIGWSGGIENPFASLFLLPIALSILSLPARWVWITSACCLLGYGVSVYFGRPMPHVHGEMGDTFNLHKTGMLVNFLVSAAVMLVFFARLAKLWRERERELATLRERFTRNEGILALATHAASVAHELNTPLATLTLLVDEMQGEDAETCRQLIAQCRDRVRALAAKADDNGAGIVSLEEVIDRWQLVRPAIELVRTGKIAGAERVDASVGHLLQALLNNAADASEQAGSRRVDLNIEASSGTLLGEIRDYGAGLGQTAPLLPGTLFRSNKPGGLGIGLALSHATVERLNGDLSMRSPAAGPGVLVQFRLPGTVRT
jgi:two-component system sensor histidine kinase RegB